MITDKEIIQAMADHLGLSPEDLDRYSTLKDEVGLGPIELNDLLTNLSQKFNISFDPEDVENLKTVNDLVVLIEDNLIE